MCKKCLKLPSNNFQNKHMCDKSDTTCVVPELMQHVLALNVLLLIHLSECRMGFLRLALISTIQRTFLPLLFIWLLYLAAFVCMRAIILSVTTITLNDVLNEF